MTPVEAEELVFTALPYPFQATTNSSSATPSFRMTSSVGDLVPAASPPCLPGQLGRGETCARHWFHFSQTILGGWCTIKNT